MQGCSVESAFASLYCVVFAIAFKACISNIGIFKTRFKVGTVKPNCNSVCLRLLRGLQHQNRLQQPVCDFGSKTSVRL